MYVIRIYPSMSNKVLEGLSEFNAVLALLEAFRTRGAHAESIMASAQLVSKCCLPGSPRVFRGFCSSSRSSRFFSSAAGAAEPGSTRPG